MPYFLFNINLMRIFQLPEGGWIGGKNWIRRIPSVYCKLQPLPADI
jgi:hypothetical protein